MITNRELMDILLSRSNGLILMDDRYVKVAFDVTCQVCAEVYFGNPDRWGQPFLIVQFNRRELAELIQLKTVITNGNKYSIGAPMW